MKNLHSYKVSLKSDFKGKRYPRKVYIQIEKWPYVTLNDLWGQILSIENLHFYNVIVQYRYNFGKFW